jgi:hypothetical protein
LADKLSNISSLVTDPPVGWSHEIVRGYVVWSLAVVVKLHTRLVMDKKALPILSARLTELFDAFNVKDATKEELDAYYALL